MILVAPYLIRAYHQWMEDSQLTPHVLVDCSKADVIVPKAYVKQNQIVLNISNEATNALVISNETISFKARFDGKSQTISVPTSAVLTIYAGENGEGMFFENGTEEAEQSSDQSSNLTLLD